MHKEIVEAARTVPIVGEYDVIVCGGGTAGFPAAVAAAREGAKVVLIEKYGFLGGVPSYCIMPAWHRFQLYHSALLEEFATKITEMGPGPSPLKSSHMEPEYVKKLALDMVLEAGVEIHLHTMIADVIKEGNAVKGVITESKSGRRAFLGKTVIDATGDGDAAYLAGAGFMKGGADGTTQGMTIRFRIGNIDFNTYFDWAQNNREYFHSIKDEQLNILREKAQKGEEFYMSADLSKYFRQFEDLKDLPLTSYFNGSSIRKNELSVNATRIHGVDGTVEEDLTKAEITCRKQEFALWNFLRRHVPGFESSYIVETAPQIGVRETRCIEGDYILTEDDCRNAVQFEDTVVRNPVGFDVHDRTYKLEIVNKLACIPYRCLLPKGLENILTAGRCISSDHIANSTVRMMITSFDTGQASGIAAALCSKYGVTPRQLPYKELKEVLISRGVL